MADVPALTAVSPVSDDVELEDILSRTQIPTVVIRKDSNSAAAAAADARIDDDDDDDDAADRLGVCTPAPMASFEVLSDVEESDMDDVTSLEAQRDVTLDAVTIEAEERVKSHTDDIASDDVDLQTNGAVVQPASTEVMDLSQNPSSDQLRDSELVTNDDPRWRDEQDQSAKVNVLAIGVPTLVFEDVDANNDTTLSSPECLVNSDNANDDTQQTWQWTADQEQGITFLTTSLSARPLNFSLYLSSCIAGWAVTSL